MKTILKKDRNYLLLSTGLCLLPIILYLVVYNSLPEQMAMQWNLSSEANWYAPKAVAVFVTPAALALIHLVSVLLRRADPKRDNVAIVFKIMLDWLIPVLSMFAAIYSILLNTGIVVSAIIPLLLIGILIIIFGNYMPKSRQSFVVGIRIPWTLNDEDNWIKTHRFAGPLWVIGGVVMIVATFAVPATNAWVGIFLGILVLIIGVPSVYSYRLYSKNKGLKEDENKTDETREI